MQNRQVSEKYPINEESLKKHLIEKEQTDEELWMRIQEKAKGKLAEREAAIELIFNNYRKVPTEADYLLRDFSSLRQPVKVRTTLAMQISKSKTNIPAALYFDLITRLNQDREPKVKNLVAPEIEEWLKPLIKLQETLRKIETFKHRPIYKEFEFNWLIFLSFDQMLRLLKMHKRGKGKEVRRMLMRVAKNKTFLNDFLKELSSISILQPRLHVLNEVLNAHVDGKFVLSIPCILPQIEGILWDIAHKKGFAVGTTIITTRGRRRPVKSAYRLVAETPMYDLMTEYLAEFFLQKVYTPNFRHAILHGRNHNYDKEEDSMKLVMLLRALTEVAKNC